MKTIIVKTQQELDALPIKFEEHTIIYIQNDSMHGRIHLKGAWENSSVEAWENSSVVAWGNSSVVARGNSSVVAKENSSVEAWENSSVVAWENSSVVARGNSSVVAWGNSSVVAKGNSSVVARENSSVVAWGNSSVVAWENSGVHLFSEYANVILFMFAVCWVLKSGKVQKKSNNATIIFPKKTEGVEGWLEEQGLEKEDGNSVLLFKRVSSALKTQEETKNETLWTIGATLTVSNWDPSESECGPNKFHACSRPYFCDEFRSKKDDKYIAIKVKVENLFVWRDASYPHKVAFRSGTVMYECDRFGNRKS